MRTIFHCDINNCFASIEMAINPSLRLFPIAVCGDPAQRRGIVLAKSETAKKCGVSTGDPLWLARQKCPNIHFVLPHFDIYEQYSERIRCYYEQITPQVEPYGLDECWLDVTDEVLHSGRPAEDLAHRIRMDIHRLFDVTISVGVSFNKVLAKLGSDLKKPDAVTCIEWANFRQKTWPLPVGALLGVGRATQEKLRRIGIQTIGELARAERKFIRAQLGKNGDKLWCYANGLDETPVCGPNVPRKSLGHGTTLPADAVSMAQIWPVLERLSDKIAFGLQTEGLTARCIQLYVRDNALMFHHYQHKLSFGISASRMIAEYGLMMLSQHYDWIRPIRAIGLCMVELEDEHASRQLPLFEERAQYLRNRREAEMDGVLRGVQERFGERTIFRGGREAVVEWCHPPGR